MAKMYVKNISSLEKVLPKTVCELPEVNCATALLGEEFSYQIAFKASKNDWCAHEMQLEVDSDILELVTVYNVRCVPVLMSHFYNFIDNNYISDEPALIPDFLEPYGSCVKVSPRTWCAVWVSVKVNDPSKAGAHKITVKFKKDGVLWGESSFELEIIAKELPKLDIPYTNWFHSDCISSYYGCDPLSERHWSLIDSFMCLAGEHGVNMLLTPIFTPPLDTKVGAERPTVQLVDVSFDGEHYSFCFDKLSRWLDLCKRNGIEYIEISHLFTQWGAEHAPKIIVSTSEGNVKKFGWETDSLGDEYKTFLTELLPPLKEFLAKNWNPEKVYFHLSDEPNEKHIEHYGEIFKFLKPLLGDFKQLDAISDYDIYSKGYIETPVVATSAIHNFLDKDINNLWAYYCCSEGHNNLSNRFIAMPSSRNRIMGVQLYKYGIKGFLQWGYNFYYARMSTHMINPYLTNDADYGFPAGDSFSVYPGINGAIPSLRLKVFHEALQDLMAAKLLESYVGREEVMKLIESNETITFTSYPASSTYQPMLREKINQRIKECL